MARKRKKAAPSVRAKTPEEAEMVKLYRVVVHLRRGDSAEGISRAVGVPRQKVLTYVRRAMACGMLKLGRVPSRLAEELKQTLGSAGREVDMDIVPARSDTREFYRWCAERVAQAIRDVLQERGRCAIAVGGGRSTYRTVRNTPDPPIITPDECKRISVFPATSGVDPTKPLLSALVVGALLRTKLAPEAEGVDAPYQAIVSDPYRTDKPWDLRRKIKDDIDLLVSGIGHKQHSYCAGVSGLASVPDDETVGEFLFQPFTRDGLPVEPEGFRVDCAEDRTPTAVDSTGAERRRTFYSLFSLRELAHAGDTRARRPIVVGIATNYLRDSHSNGRHVVNGQGAARGDPGTQQVSKVEAALGALRGGLIQRLIVPMDLAEEILGRGLQDEVSQLQLA